MIGLGQTLIPDANFELYLISQGYDTPPINGSVPTASIDTVTSLDVSSLSITDLTGIEDFTALTYLNCGNNQLTSLDVSQNTALTLFRCYNNQLTSLDVSQNLALIELFCGGNQLTNLDVSTNLALIILLCQNNPNLTCINVDDVTYSTTNWTNIDPQHYFSTNCPPPSAIQEHTINKELLKVTDLLGRETKGKTNEPLFYIYDDGTVEKRINKE
jgi:hypothetical protein